MTNREEVAKKLREDGLRLDQSDMSTIRQAFVAIDKGVEAPSGREFSLLFDRLADLIDPTCKYLPVTCATWFDDNDEEHVDKHLEAFENAGTAFCSCCGYIVMTGEEGWFDYKREEHGNRLIPNFNYCPNCGARVVRRNVQA